MTEPSIEVAGITRFNHEDRRYRCTNLAGWWGSAQPRSELAAAPGAGSVPIGPWELAEAYYLLEGWLTGFDRTELGQLRRDLLAALPPSRDVPLKVFGNGGDIDLQAFVRRYDRPELEVVGRNMSFSFPLVAGDPFKYATEALEGTMGVFTGESWFREYDPVAYYRTYDTVGGFREYQQQANTSDLPTATELISPGTLTSRRIIVEVVGPLTRGDWFLLNETTGDRLWADLSLAAGQSILFDCFTQRATLNGTSIDHLIFGDFLTLEPGSNLYRLQAGTQSAGFASLISALPAYE